MKAIIIYSTYPSREEAEKISDLLLEQKLVACSQISEIDSKFFWQNKLDKQNEFMMTAKTLSRNFKEVEKLIKENHSYFVPEIISVKINDISKSYLNWMKENVK